MNVETVCTTDDPCDDLSAHRRHASSGDSVKLLPTFRPTRRAPSIRAERGGRVARLEQASGMEIRDLAAFRKRSPPGMTFLPVTVRSFGHSLEAFDEESLSGEEAAACSPPLSGAVTSPPGCGPFLQLPDGLLRGADSAKNWVPASCGAQESERIALRDLGRIRA
ncbi:MAG: glucuronate isomerase [Akkermansia sp.]